MCAFLSPVLAGDVRCPRLAIPCPWCVPQVKQEHGNAAPNAASAGAAATAGAASAAAAAEAAEAAAGGVVSIKTEQPVAASATSAAAAPAAATSVETVNNGMDVDGDQPGSAAGVAEGNVAGAAAEAVAGEKPDGSSNNGAIASNGSSDAIGVEGAPAAAGPSNGGASEALKPNPQEAKQEPAGTGDDPSAAVAIGGGGGGVSRDASSSATSSASGGSGGRSQRLPLDPASVHPAFAGRRPLSRHESPASGRAYGLWDPASVHPAYFGHLRHDGEAAGAAGLSGWTGAGDGGVLDRALRVLRGAADSEAGGGGGGGGGGTGKGGAVGVVRWSAEERATVLGLLCEEACVTGVALDHMKVRS